MFYLITSGLFILSGVVVYLLPLELTIVVTHIVLLLGISEVYLRLKGTSIIKILPLEDFKKGDILKVINLSIYSIPIIAFLNLSASIFYEILGWTFPYELPLDFDFASLILNFIMISIVASIVEEVYFRGVILNVVKDYLNPIKSSLLVALMFAIFHFHPSNFFGPLYLGFIYGLLTLGKRNIALSALGHMLNNGIVLVMTYYSYLASSKMEVTQTDLTLNEMLYALLFWGILAVWGGYFTLKLIKKFELDLTAKPTKKWNIIDFVPIGFTIIIYLAITTL
jgi:membrane protease YdiL (CAAX protease family)